MAARSAYGDFDYYSFMEVTPCMTLRDSESVIQIFLVVDTLNADTNLVVGTVSSRNGYGQPIAVGLDLDKTTTRKVITSMDK